MSALPHKPADLAADQASDGVWTGAQETGAAPPRRLTDEQERAAASREGSLLLAAGAGSGKTAVLVERFARAVVQDGIAPGRILAITFTERAAGELRERVRARLLELGEREAARQAEAAFVGTFHGFCARVLRAHPLQAGVEPSFRILEEAFASRLQRQAFAAALAGFVAGEREAAVELAAAYGADSLRAIVLGAYEQLRSQGQLEPRLPRPSAGAGPGARADGGRARADGGGVQVDGESEADGAGGQVDGGGVPARGAGRAEEEQRAIAACALIDELLGRFGEAYAQRKRARGALDFDDLELLARELLRRRSLREAWSQRFALLMVDEFQDTNQRQLQILAALDRDNLFTVGDELQSIYSFRHADVGLFRERGERLAEGEAVLALTRNFRSRPPILVAVRRMFAQRMGRRFTALAPTRPAAPAAEPAVELLLSDRAGPERVVAGVPPPPTKRPLGAVADAAPWRQAEARLLAARIGELIATEGVAAGEVVVLLRALGDLPLYEAALRAQAIPTVAAVGGFWSHQQVADLLAWLRALANPLDELALYSALASPLAGLSSDGLALIATFARERSNGVWRAIEQLGDRLGAMLGESDRERLARFRAVFAAERRELALRPIAELLVRAIAASGYERHLLALDWGERRLASVHKLLRLARSFEAQEGRDLRGFLDHVAHVEAALGGREPDALAGEELDAVRLMSIHAAKGLEFPVVCVADLGREPNLRQGDLLVDAADDRIGLRLPSLERGESAPALAYAELREQRRQAQEEEEDRVLYVACTRARERLILSGAVPFERWPQPRPGSVPIAWLAPALVPGIIEQAANAQLGEEAITISLEDGLRVRCLFDRPAAASVARGAIGGNAAATPSVPMGVPGGAAASPSVPRGRGGATVADRGVTRGAVRQALPAATLPSATLPAARLPAATLPAERSKSQRQPRPHSDPGGTVSYSSLTELERCGYRYYLERVLRLPERRDAAGEPGEGLDARLRGTIVHALLERVDFASEHPPRRREVEQVARRLGVSVAARECEQIVAMLARALASEQAERLRVLGRGRREHPFAFSLGGEEPLVSGFVDLLVDLPDGSVLIVDYKSDRLQDEEDLEQLVLRDYAFQRQLYALAALEAGAAGVEVAHWFLERPSRWASAHFGADERERLRASLTERLAALRRRGYAVSDAPHRDLCLTCPGRGGLCKWGETRTMGARSTTLAM